jgi:SAM-dependent methyltransferase
MEKCRACGTNLGEPFISLGNSPLSNSYLNPERLAHKEATYPLDIFLCPSCYLVQIDVFEKAETIFNSDYPYFSSYSDSWLLHCRTYVEMMVSRFAIQPSRFVVEIASNDGYLLQYFKERGIPCLGIEPAVGTAKVAREKGIRTLTEYFTAEFASVLRAQNQSADLIIGNNVLAHNPGINDFVAGLSILLKPSGIITLEFPHLLQMILNAEFDTVYHEHFSYLSLFSIQKLFQRHGLTIFDVEEIPTHGGSLRVFAGHTAQKAHVVTSNVQSVIDKERYGGLFSGVVYRNFSERVIKIKRDLLGFLVDAKKRGNSVAAYGAPAKGNTLLNYCGISGDLIEYTVDRNPYKQGKYLPGSRIPILHPENVKLTKPDYLLVLPWNIKQEIMAQMGDIRQWGGKFVTAIPELIID